MNRRTFLAAAAASLAFSSRHVGAQQMAQLSGVTAVSELTGAEVDLGRTGFAFYGRLLDTRNDTETLGFSSETSDGAVRFIPAGTDAEAYLNDLVDPVAAQMETSELVGMDIFDDGGWMAMTVETTEGKSRGMYREVQLNAFPGYDLEVSLFSDEDAFEADFDLMQQVQLEGFEPFLFTQESEMPAMIFSTTTSSSSAGTGRNSGTTQSGTSTTNTRGSESTSAGGPGELDTDGVIQAVREHQTQFNGELDRFYEIVEMIGSETATDEDEADWFDELLTFMFSWSGYPEAASALTFPAELSSLESTYFEWSDAVGLMGTTMTEWIMGEGDIDTFFDAIEVAVQLNSALSAELRTLGVVIKPVGHGFTQTTANRLRLVDRHARAARAA